MAVCFINPPSPHLKQPKAQIPLGILYIAGYLRQFDQDVIVKNYSGHSFDEAINELPQSNVYALTCTSLQLPMINKFAKAIKHKYFTSRIIIGGPGTCTPEYIDWENVDVAVQGEGEFAMRALMYNKTNFRGLYYGDTIPDLDILPYPARDLIEELGGNVFAYDKNYLGEDSTQLITSRGCPFKCTFCAAPQINCTMRFRSVSSILAEVDHVIDQYGTRQFRIADDTFLLDINRLNDICKGLYKRDIAFRISTRVKPLSEKSLRIMHDAGLKEISLGIESADDAVLKGFKKGATVKDNIKALKLCRKVGITTRILMMIRTPFQTPDTVVKNVEFIKNVPFDIVACTHYLPLPGSDVWNNPNDYGITIVDKDLSHYNFYGYGPKGRRQLEKIFLYNDRDTDEVNRESTVFMDFLESTGKVNTG